LDGIIGTILINAITKVTIFIFGLVNLTFVIPTGQIFIMGWRDLIIQSWDSPVATARLSSQSALERL
jgi:hypothetical protein